MYEKQFRFIRSTYAEEYASLSPCLREAELFCRVTEEMPLEILPGDEFAGWYGGVEDKELLPDAVFPRVPVISDEKNICRAELHRGHHTQVSFTTAHTCIDYGAILRNGLAAYLEKIAEERKKDPENELLRAMALSLEAACGYAQRYRALALEKAQTAEPAENERLLTIAGGLSRVPRYGAQSFREAVQSVWLMHSLIPMAERSWASISLGRLDQYLYPFFAAHLASGGTKEEAKAVLKHLFRLLDSYGDGACALNLGGMDAQGNEQINDLTLLLIEVEKEMALRAPIIAFRVTEKTPDDVLDSLIDFDLFRIGQPTFYGEENCRRAVAGRGIPENEAAGFSCNSCMGLVLAGQEFADMWGVVLNAHLPLELALNDGKPVFGTLPVELVPFGAVTDKESLFRGYAHYFRQLASLCADLSHAWAEEFAVNDPDPLLSALTEGCVERRQDRAIGARYNTVTVETMGLVNTLNAITAVGRLVFEEKRYTVGALLAAIQADYDGYDQLRSDILSCPKYGEDHPEVNAAVRRVTSTISETFRALQKDNRYYLPSLHTIDGNVSYGSTLHATLDGRRAGEPVNKNADPSHLLKKAEHTAVIRSAAAADQIGFSGGQPVDLYFDKAWFADKALRDKLRALIRVCFRLGGLQLQVNSVDLDLLKKAHPDPEKYPHIIIRKGGYSVRFAELGRAAREEFITVMSRY